MAATQKTADDLLPEIVNDVHGAAESGARRQRRQRSLAMSAHLPVQPS